MPTVDFSAPQPNSGFLLDRLREARWRRFAALGDSLTEGIGDDVAGYVRTPWVAAVATALKGLHPDFSFLNLGQRALTTRQIRETQLQPALEFKPDLASVLAGGNDLFATKFEPDAVERDLEAMVVALKDTGATVFISAMLNITRSGLYPQAANDFLLPRLTAIREICRSVAERHDPIFFDYFDHPMAADTSIYSADLQHVNMKGQSLFAEAYLRGLAAHINGHT